MTSEYFGPLLFIDVSLIVMLYPISFLPLTFLISKYLKKPAIKMILFTFFGGGIGALFFEIIYDARFVEEFNLSIITSILLFSVAGVIFSLVETVIKKNIRFV